MVFWFCRDDQIIFNGIIFYVGYFTLPGGKNMPLWRADGVVITMLLHMGPVEFLYYWLHRALHHHYLYSRYHSHHHSSIVTEPITCKKLRPNSHITCRSYKNKGLFGYQEGPNTLAKVESNLDIPIIRTLQV